MRHGTGALKHPNGEEYVGEWQYGKMGTWCVRVESWQGSVQARLHVHGIWWSKDRGIYDSITVRVVCAVVCI